MVDFSKTKPSKNVKDHTDPKRSLRAYMFSPWAPWETGDFDWNEKELGRLKKGEDVLNILRERMRNNFLMNWLTEGSYRPAYNFDFHREDFDTHSNLRKRSQGSAYDNY